MNKPTHVTLRIETVESILTLIASHKLSEVIELWNVVNQEVQQSIMIQMDKEQNNGND